MKVDPTVSDKLVVECWEREMSTRATLGILAQKAEQKHPQTRKHVARMELAAVLGPGPVRRASLRVEPALSLAGQTGRKKLSWGQCRATGSAPEA